jgi:hypothetical protein
MREPAPDLIWGGGLQGCGRIRQLFSQLLAEQAEYFIELALHGDHLLAHVERDFGAFHIHSHFFDEQVSNAHAIDLIHGVEFLPPPDDRTDHFFLFQAPDEFCVNAANFSDFRNAQIFSRHRSIPLLQP